MIYLRPVEPKDTNLLFELKNDPDVIRYSVVSNQPIEIEVHRRYLKENLNYCNRLYCILDSMVNGVVGTVGVSIEPLNKAEINIRILKKYRQHGYGSFGVNWMVKHVRKLLPTHGIYAKIVWDNIASRELFKSCGFTECTHQPSTGIVWYSL